MTGLLNSISGSLQDAARDSGQSVTNSGSIRAPMPEMEEFHVTRLVEAQDLVPEMSREASLDGFTHVSTLVNIGCERRVALAMKYQSVQRTTVTGGHKVMWLLGRAVEKHVREQVITSRERNGIYGVWVCHCGETCHTGFFPETVCRFCHRKLFEYREPVLREPEFKITGSPDLTLRDRGFFYPVEIKSMNPDQFKELEKPLPDHVAQVLLYQEIYHRDGFMMHENVVLIYVNKGFRWGSRDKVYKEYHINGQTETARIIVRDLLELADRLASGRVPERTLCSTPQNPTARKCDQCHLCFD